MTVVISAQNVMNRAFCMLRKVAPSTINQCVFLDLHSHKICNTCLHSVSLTNQVKTMEAGLQSSRIHSLLIPNLTYVLRPKTIVVTNRHTVTARTSHFQSDTGFPKFECCPGGGGRAGDGVGGAAMAIWKYGAGCFVGEQSV